MKILVIGAGAIGGYFGGRLAYGDNDVFFITRGEHLKAIENNGLTVESIHGDFNIRVKSGTSFEPILDLDLILVCVKLHDTHSILPHIKKQVSENTVVISLQNGLEGDEFLKEAVPKSRLIGGIAFIGANRVAPGKIRHTATGFITIGEWDGKKTERIEKIQKTFLDAGIDCRLTNRMREAKWEKLIWNVGFNGLSALTDMSAKSLLEHEPTRKIVRLLMEELIKVAHKLGIEVDPVEVDRQIKITERMGEVIPSMLQDMRAGRKTEIDFINGKVYREAEKLGIPTPYNETVWAAVSLLDKAATQL